LAFENGIHEGDFDRLLNSLVKRRLLVRNKTTEDGSFLYSPGLDLDFMSLALEPELAELKKIHDGILRARPQVLEDETDSIAKPDVQGMESVDLSEGSVEYVFDNQPHSIAAVGSGASLFLNTEGKMVVIGMFDVIELGCEKAIDLGAINLSDFISRLQEFQLMQESLRK
jgi:hypothetical protein